MKILSPRAATVGQLFPKKTSQKRLLGIWAHPDDESLNMGGIFALAAREGIETKILCLTQGEMGLSERSNSRVRHKELLRAANILGVSHIQHASFPDAQLSSHQSGVVEFLREEIERYQPQVIITHDPSGKSGHPDHIAVSQAVFQIWQQHKYAWELYYVVLSQDEKRFLSQHRPFVKWGNMPQGSKRIKIDAVLPQKISACLAHKSQQAALSTPFPMHIMKALFPHEDLHQASTQKKYRFQFVNFKTNRYTYQAKSKKIIPKK